VPPPEGTPGGRAGRRAAGGAPLAGRRRRAPPEGAAGGPRARTAGVRARCRLVSGPDVVYRPRPVTTSSRRGIRAAGRSGSVLSCPHLAGTHSSRSRRRVRRPP